MNTLQFNAFLEIIPLVGSAIFVVYLSTKYRWKNSQKPPGLETR